MQQLDYLQQIAAVLTFAERQHVTPHAFRQTVATVGVRQMREPHNA